MFYTLFLFYTKSVIMEGIYTKTQRVLLTSLILLTVLFSKAQVAGYSFSQSTGTYTPLSGGTVYGTSSTDDQRFVDPATPAGGTTTTGVGIPIGFNFIYNLDTFDRIAINANGWISLGKSALTPSVNLSSTSSYNCLASTSVITPAALRARVAGVGKDMQGRVGGTITVQTIGTTPNQVCVVEWANYRRYSKTGDTLNFQIRLNETSNVAEVMFGKMVFDGSSTGTGTSAPQLGLGGFAASDFNSRTTTTDWNNTTAATLNNQGCDINNGAGVIYPVSGTDMAWTPPTCFSPIAFTAIAGITTAGLNWQLPASGSPQNFEWTVVPQGNGPQTGVVSGGTLASTDTTVIATGLSAATAYSAYIRTICTPGDTSNFIGPVNFTTNCAAVVAPYCQDFENSGTIPSCWSQGAGNAEPWKFSNTGSGNHIGNNGVISGATTSGGYFAWVDDSSPNSLGTTLQSPLIDVSGLTTPMLQFFLLSNNEGYTNVDFSVDVFDGAAWNTGVVTHNTNTVGGWEQISVILNGLTITGPIQLRFIVNETNGSDFYDDVAIDDICVVEAPACTNPPVAGIISGDSLTCPSSAVTLTLSGQTQATALQWQTSTDSLAWTDISGETGSTYTTQPIISKTYFRVKVTCSDSAFTAGFPIDLNSLFACYCAPTYAYGCGLGDEIANVTLDTLNNTSACTPSPYYTFYDSVVIPDLPKTSTQSISITFGSDGSQYAGVWIDYNQDGDFSDAGEFVAFNTVSGGSGGTITLNFIVPATATLGQTLMRVRGGDDSQMGNTPCGASAEDYGESEDYIVNITAAPLCTDPPVAGTISGNSLTCPSTSVTLTLLGQTLGTSVQWQTSTDSLAWTDLPGDTNTSYTTQPITAKTYFRVKVTCSDSAFTAGFPVDLNSLFACYCAPTYSYGCGFGDEIANVSLGALNNSSACTPAPYYTFYDSVTVPDLPQTTTQTISITFGSDGNQYAGVWIDYNQDGDFSDSTEFVAFNTVSGGSGGTITLNFIVPASATLGQTLMRVRGGDDSQMGNTPCGASAEDYGESEDYIVNITAAPSCAAPTSVSVAVAGDSATVSFVSTGLSTTIEYGPVGFTPGTGTVVNGIDSPYVISSLAPHTTYSFYLQDSCSGALSPPVGPTNFTTPCGIETAPYCQSFENGGAIPNCWAQGAGNAEPWKFSNTGSGNHIGNSGVITGTTTSGGYFAWVDDSSPNSLGTTLQSPPIDVSGLTTPLLQFFLLSNNEGYTNVDFSVDVFDGAAWNTGVFTHNTNTVGGWEQISVPLNGLTITGPIQLRFIVNETNGTDFYDDVAIDDICVIETPVCTDPPVAGIISGDSLTCPSSPITLTLSGQTQATALQWQISTDSLAWSDISGATGKIYTTLLSSESYFRVKVTCSDSAFTAGFHVGLNAVTNCYCTSTATFTADEDIFNVTLGSLNNSSTCSSTGTGTSVLNQYSDYTTTVAAPSLQRTVSYPFSVQVGTCGTGSYNNVTAIYIDFNRNGLYTDPGEKVYLSATATSGAHFETGNIIVPAGADTGYAGMRVITVETSTPGNITPCGTYSWGETEDYLVHLEAAPLCTNPPVAGTIGGSNLTCPSTSPTLTLMGYTLGTAVQWQTSTDSLTWTDILGATNSTYTTQPLSSEVYFRAKVTCSDSAFTAGFHITIDSFTHCYCASSATYTGDEDIFNVTLGSLNNSSTCLSTGTGASVLNQYSDYTTTVAAPSLQRALTYPFSVQVGTCGGNWDNSTAIYIDFNQNGLFTDPGENVYLSAVAGNGLHFETGSIAIPLLADTGYTRMRVITVETSTPGDITPCGTYGWGETEDYLVHLEAAPACIPPTSITVAAADTFATVSFVSMGLATTIEYGPAGFTPGTGTIVSGITSPYVISPLSATTAYSFYLQDTCSGTSSQVAGPINFSTACSPYPTPGNGFANAIQVTGTFFTDTVNTSACYGDNSATRPGKDVFLRVGGDSCITSITVSLCGTSFDTYLFIRDSSNTTTLYSNDDFCNLQSQVTFTPTPGTSYIAVAEPYSSTATGSFAITVTQALDVPVVSHASASPSCQGVQDGSAWVTVSSVGSHVATYAWSNGSTTDTITNIASGTYYVTVTTACGSVVDSVIVSPTFNATVTSVTNVSCNGGNNGAIDITVTNGTAPYTYAWNNSDTTEDISGLTAGLYDLTVSEAGGCSVTVNATISEPAVLAVSLDTLVNVLCNSDSTGAVNIAVSGGTQVLSPNQLSTTFAGGNGCTGGNMFDLLLNKDVVINQLDVSLATTASQPVSVYYKTGTYNGFETNPGAWTLYDTYTVTGLGTGIPTPVVLSTPLSLPAGQYAIYVYADVDYTNLAVGTTYSTPDMVLTVGVGLCDPFDLVNVGRGWNGNIHYLSSFGYNYLWSNGDTTQDLSGVPVGTYDVTITDANSCTATASYTINEPTPLIPSLDSMIGINCHGLAQGAVYISVAGGVSPYSYSWSNGSTDQDLVGVPAGIYTGTITDANGCVFVSPQVPITEPSAIALTTDSVMEVTCNGNSNGGVDISVSGGIPPYSYLWSDSTTNEDLAGVSAGTYSIAIVDSNGCVYTDSSFVVTEPAALALSFDSVMNVSCAGAADGAVYASATGGTGALSFAWSTADTTTNISGLSGGAYVVTVADENACTATLTQMIAEPDSLNPSLDTLINVACFGDNSGAIEISVNGGTAPYTFNWSNGDTTEDLMNLAVGTYTGTITDANGCVFVSPQVPISQPSVGLSASSVSTDQIQGGNMGAIDVTVAGGTSPYSFNWNTGATSEDLSSLGAGVYSCTITDANGCNTVVTDTVNLIIGIGEVVGSYSLNLYPNPTHNQVTIDVNLSTSNDVTVVIYSVDGKLIHQFSKQNVLIAQFNMSFANEADGVYMAKVTVGDHTTIHRIIVAK